jgi:hypothetical protein
VFHSVCGWGGGSKTKQCLDLTLHSSILDEASTPSFNTNRADKLDTNKKICICLFSLVTGLNNIKVNLGFILRCLL